MRSTEFFPLRVVTFENAIIMSDDTTTSTISRAEIARWTKRIRAAFKVFDKDDTNTVDRREVGSLMRYLGYFPTEADIANVILPEMMEDHDMSSNVTYNAFEKKMLEIMSTDEYDPDIFDTKLYHAFQVTFTTFT